MRDVKRSIDIIGANGDMNMLFERNSKYVRERYLNSYCKLNDLKSTSIRKYLYSLKDFCEFLLKSGVKVDSSINLKDVKILKQNVKLWRKKYSKNAKKEKIATRAKDYELLITPEQVEMYFNSDVAKSALAVLEKLEDETYVISRTEYCSLRDHIYVIILFGNACRSGVPAGLLMSQYSEAMTDSDGNVKMSVADHKTDYIFGDAPIV